MAKRSAASSWSSVEIIGGYNVSPPPNSVEPSSLALTFYDIPWLFCRSAAQPIFLYEYPYPTCQFLSTTLPALTHSLSLALQHFFAFAATLVLPAPTPIISYDQGNYISLVVAESKGDFLHLSGNHQRCVEDLHPLVPPLASGSLLSAQITIFPNAGICIAFAYLHVGADGRTFNSFIKTWASLCRDPRFLVNPLPFYDRTVIKDTYGLHSAFINHYLTNANANSLLPPTATTSTSNMVRATFLMCPAHCDKLKRWIVNRCNSTSKPQPPYLTPSNLTCAFVWVCLIKAQARTGKLKLFGKKPSYLGFNPGCIARLDYPVPASYFGNCIGFARCMGMESDLCGEDGLIFAADAIGNRVKQLDEAVLKGAENWISDWEVFYEAGHGDDVMVMVVGSPKLDFYDTDFGWGRPTKIEEISIDNYANAISFTQSRHVRGGIEVGLALPKPKMDAFASFFTQIQEQGLELSS